MKLAKLSLKDRPVFNRYLALGRHELSVYAFENIFIWKALFDIGWSVIDKSLCVFFRDGFGCFAYLDLLAEEKAPAAAGFAFELMDGINKNKDISRIENVEEKELDFYRGLGYECRIKSYDYICERGSLAGLKGGGFKSKRASLNYFIKHYDYEYLNFSPKERSACLQLYHLWMEQRKPKGTDTLYLGMLEDSLKAFKVMLSNYKDLHLEARIVRINKKTAGFTFGFKLNNDTFCVLYEITDLTVKGLAQFIFRSFCDELKNYRYINIMDDSGLENLKRVKLSYHPVKLVPAYIVKKGN